MNQYTHAVLAQQILPQVHPTNPAAYLWGAVAPDVRYLAGLRRDATHLPDEEIIRWFSSYPACDSFIQGYRVHCMLDRIDPVQVVGQAFPLNLLSRVLPKKISYQHMTVVIELYTMQAFPNGLTLRGEHNAILEGLGVSYAQSAAFASAMADYISAPSFETAARNFVRLGIIEDARLEKYMQAYQKIKRNRILLTILMTSVKNARLDKLAASLYRELPNKQ